MLDILDYAIDQKYNNDTTTTCPSTSTSTDSIKSITSSATANVNLASISNKRQRRTVNGTYNSTSKKIKLLRFDGTMTQIQRSSVIQTFQNDSSTQVLLISLK